MAAPINNPSPKGWLSRSGREHPLALKNRLMLPPPQQHKVTRPRKVLRVNKSTGN